MNDRIRRIEEAIGNYTDGALVTRVSDVAALLADFKEAVELLNHGCTCPCNTWKDDAKHFLAKLNDERVS